MRRGLVAVVGAAALAMAVGAGIAVSAQLNAAASKPKALFATLNGAREVSTAGEKGVGDPNGKGSFSAIFDGGKLCYGVTAGNIEDPVAAHIHRAKAGRNGDVVVTLAHPASGDPGASSACTDVGSELAGQIRDNPKRFYVNVHTESFPGGAIRGQLFKSAGK
jgi:CHRD domain